MRSMREYSANVISFFLTNKFLKTSLLITPGFFYAIKKNEEFV